VRRLWERWVAWTGRLEDRRPLALVRALVPLAILGDLLAMLWRGAMPAVLLPADRGGIGSQPAWWSVVDEVWWGGQAAWLACALSLPLVSARVVARPAIVVAVLASSQLGHLFVPGDRGIDRMLRTVLLVLLFSRVTAQDRPERVEAWPSDLIRWFLVLVYLSAGVAKLDPDLDWLMGDPPELYQILADPMGGRLDPVRWYDHPWLFRLGGAATLVLELSAPLLLTRWAPLWALFAAPIHLGIAAMMDLGMFSWGMLAMYPVLFGPWLRERSAASRSPGP
jgi:hypothetical protein